VAYEIRAMSLAEVLDSSFRILRDHFLAIAGVSAIVNVPVALGQSLMAAEAEAGASLSLPAIGIAFAFLTFALASPVVGAAVTHLIGEVYLGRPAHIGEAFRVALRILIPLFGTSLLVGLIMIGMTLLLILPGIWFMLGATVISQVMVIERRFGMNAVRRSLELMKGHRGRAFLIVVLVMVLSGVVGFAFDLAVGSLPWLGGAASGFAQAVTGAFASVVFVVLYFDIRCRKEAFDIQHLAQLVQAEGAAAPAPAS
jgi:hypothetical protein